MSGDPFYDRLLLAWLILALVAAPVLLKIRAPYGRYASAARGPALPAAAGWLLMELPAVLAFGYFFLAGAAPKTAPMWVFFALWQAHYVHRSLIYPWCQRGGASMPLAIVAAAFGFNLVNGYLNGAYLGALSGGYPAGWLADPRFAAGALLFLAGAGINLHADAVLRALRAPRERGYRVPEGGLYRWVSCPNYLGELIEWCGFALMTFSPAAAVFAVWTAANLVPRALAHHRWYRERFPDYPRARRAIVPFLL